MDAKRTAELATFFAAIERAPGRAPGASGAIRGSAGEPTPHGRTHGPARPAPCQCGGEHHFVAAGDADLEPLFAEPPYVPPDEHDDDYSELNGHVGYAHTMATRRARFHQGGTEGTGPVDSGEAWQYSTPIPRARSVGASSVHDPVWASAVAPDSRMTRCLRATAPTWPSRLVWGGVLAVWGLGLIAWALGA